MASKPAVTSKLNLSVKLITVPEKRGDINTCYAIDSITKLPKAMYFPNKFVKQLAVGKFYHLRKVNCGCNLNLKEESYMYGDLYCLFHKNKYNKKPKPWPAS